jgi:hypothetical protein
MRTLLREVMEQARDDDAGARQTVIGHGPLPVSSKVYQGSEPSLHLIGRNGMHKYNNQDHAMMTAMLTARNILAGEPIYDIWQVNEDAEYHEAGVSSGQAALAGECKGEVPGGLKRCCGAEMRLRCNF